MQHNAHCADWIAHKQGCIGLVWFMWDKFGGYYTAQSPYGIYNFRLR